MERKHSGGEGPHPTRAPLPARRPPHLDAVHRGNSRRRRLAPDDDALPVVSALPALLCLALSLKGAEGVRIGQLQRLHKEAKKEHLKQATPPGKAVESTLLLLLLNLRKSPLPLADEALENPTSSNRCLSRGRPGVTSPTPEKGPR